MKTLESLRLRAFGCSAPGAVLVGIVFFATVVIYSLVSTGDGQVPRYRILQSATFVLQGGAAGSQWNAENSGWNCDNFRDASGAVPQGIRAQGPDEQRLYYNRVPKCGSTTLYNLLRKLAPINGFVHYNSKLYDQKRISEVEQMNLVRNVSSTQAPCSFDRHVFFVNFTRFGSQRPVYVNLIRDPVERLISSFFYRRQAARLNPRNNASHYWMTKNFEFCVTSKDPECSYVNGEKYGVLLVPYFCGQADQCLKLNDPWALQTAKRNIEESYAVVGVLEEMNATLTVLEAFVPNFFRGVVELYHSSEHHWNRNFQKEYVSEETKALIKANLTAEYEFYYFALQRLHQQFRSAYASISALKNLQLRLKNSLTGSNSAVT